MGRIYVFGYGGLHLRYVVKGCKGFYALLHPASLYPKFLHHRFSEGDIQIVSPGNLPLIVDFKVRADGGKEHGLFKIGPQGPKGRVKADMPVCDGTGLIGNEHIHSPQILYAHELLYQHLLFGQHSRSCREGGGDQNGKELWGDSDRYRKCE